MRFASFRSGGFTIMAVINLPERKLTKRTSVHWAKICFEAVILDVIETEKMRLMGVGKGILGQATILVLIDFCPV